MRRRLVQSTLAVVLVAVALLGVPLAVAGVLIQAAYAEQTAQDRASRLGARIENRLRTGQPVDDGVLAFEALSDDTYVYASTEGYEPIVHGAPHRRPVRGEYRSTETYVLVEESGAALLRAQIRIVLLVLVAAVVAVLAAVALGLLQARRLAEPLDDLAARARRLGSGSTRATFPRYAIPEVDEVVEALESGSARLGAMLASERQFASDASHQLRTPLTALSMRLEEIASSEDLDAMQEEARIALGQVERLSAVVDHLLTAARRSVSSTALRVDLDAVLHQQLTELRPAFEASGRSLQRSGRPGLVALATPGGLAQIVTTLLENSLIHGAGRTEVRTRTSGALVVVEVTDEGPGVPPELGNRVFERSVSGRGSGTGLGLALARDLAEADGGRLELVSLRPPVFAVFLPAPSPDGDLGGGWSVGSGQRVPSER